KKLKTRPASWADLWNPEYKGRLGLSTPASTLGTVTLLTLARLRGGNEANVEPGFEAVKSLLSSVSSIQAVPANLRTLLERGEIRSEERRVGKECRSRWGADALKNREI